MCKRIAAATLVLALALPARGADLASELSRILDEERQRSGAPALSLALVQNGELVAEVASGYADVDAKREATPETIFGAASVSKLMTATLAMRAVERGALALDAPANQYLPTERWIRDASGAPMPATLRQLLTHTSGAPVSWSGIQFEANDGTPDMNELLAHGLRTIRAPGEKIIYANDAYVLLGYLAAQAGGRDFADLAREELFAPLGMTSTSFRRTPDLAARSAIGYGGYLGGDASLGPPFESVVNPAGSLVTTPRDLTRFARMVIARGELDGVRILQADTLAQMEQIHALPNPEQDEGYGLGFLVRQRGGRKQVWHDGDLPGVAARLVILPELRAAVAVLSNMNDHDPVNVSARRALVLVAGPEPVDAPPVPDVASLATWTGTYRAADMMPPSFGALALLFNLEVSARDGQLSAYIPVIGDAIELEPLGGNRFRILGGTLDDSTLLFAPDGSRLYASFVEMRRVGPLQGARAILAYLAIAGVALLAALVWLGLRLVRRLRRV